jgi:hypothetical protein
MQLKTSLPQVRNALPDNVVLWVGGGGVARQRILIEGVQVMGPLSDLSDAVSNWRNT